MPRYRSFGRFAFGLASVWLFVSVGVGIRIGSGEATFVDTVFSSRLSLLRTHFAFRPDAERILFLGSSRSMTGIDADSFAELRSESSRPTIAFDFGVPAGGPIASNLYLRRSLDRGIVPDRVVLEVLPPFLAGQNGLVPEREWLTPDRLHPSEAAWFRSQGLAVSVPSQTDRWLMPTHVWRRGLQNRYLPNWVADGSNHAADERTRACGFAPLEAPSADPERRRLALEHTRGQYRTILDGFRIGAPMLACLEDTLRVCRDRGIAASVLLMPESSEFRGWYPEGASLGILDAVRHSAEKFGAPVTDHRTAMPDGAFADGHHLHPAGAGEYTRLLAARFAESQPK